MTSPNSRALDAFLQMVRNLGPMRLAVMGGVVLGLIGFFIFLTTRLTSPQMALLYGDLQQDDSARIVNQLEGMGIPFEIKRAGADLIISYHSKEVARWLEG